MNSLLEFPHRSHSLSGMDYKGLDRISGAALMLLTFSLQSLKAQDSVRGTMITGFGDMATIKQKAEAGDAHSQGLLGDALAANFRSIDALDWYRKAASQGSVQAAYHTGHLLVFGRVGIPKDQTVSPNPSEGIHWTFQAATNLYADALHDMSRAYQQGLGVGTNMVQAYAWQQLYAETRSGSIVGKVELNQMALKLDTSTIREAQELASQFKGGGWQPLSIQRIPSESMLKLNGFVTGKTPLAIINGKTFAEGESQMLKGIRPDPIAVKCLKIDKDSVLISVEGEDTPRRLTVK